MHRSCLYVLLGECCRNVGRHEVVLGHNLGLEPYTHRVVCAERHYVAYAVYTLDFGTTLIFM